MPEAPSMQLAGSILDIAARHAYVFDNGLCSPDFFDVEKRMASEEFALLRERCETDQRILEIGCLTGLNLLGLATLGYEQLQGLDFVAGAIDWLRAETRRRGLNIQATWVDQYPCALHFDFDRMICFDVLEHQQNVGKFLSSTLRDLTPNGRILFLIPKGREYFDCGHVAFFPDCECLRNVLEYFFEVEELFELKSCPKLFACCKRKYHADR